MNIFTKTQEIGLNMKLAKNNQSQLIANGRLERRDDDSPDPKHIRP